MPPNFTTAYQGQTELSQRSFAMRTSLEVINRSAILLHIPNDHGNAVKVILGGADGPLVTVDPARHIHVSQSVGPGEPEVGKAVSGILKGSQEIDRLANEAK